MSNPEEPPIYPRYCFHLAPTVNTWCLFRAADIHVLGRPQGFEGENFYFYRNLPIKWVRIVGVVVAIDDFEKSGRRVFTVDDSSGACIECQVVVASPTQEMDAQQRAAGDQSKAGTNPAPAVMLYGSIDIGSVVDVKGGISTFRDEKQINIEKITTLQSTSQEMALWEKRTRFQAEVLAKPWVLRNREIRRCRKEAERDDEEAERKRKQIRDRIKGWTDKRSVPEKPAEQPPQRNRQQPSKSTANLDLEQILQLEGRGKYDALGL